MEEDGKPLQRKDVDPMCCKQKRRRLVFSSQKGNVQSYLPYVGSADFRGDDYQGIRTCVIKSKVCQYHAVPTSPCTRFSLLTEHENANDRTSKTAVLLYFPSINTGLYQASKLPFGISQDRAHKPGKSTQRTQAPASTQASRSDTNSGGASERTSGPTQAPTSPSRHARQEEDGSQLRNLHIPPNESVIQNPSKPSTSTMHPTIHPHPPPRSSYPSSYQSIYMNSLYLSVLTPNPNLCLAPP